MGPIKNRPAIHAQLGLLDVRRLLFTSLPVLLVAAFGSPDAVADDPASVHPTDILDVGDDHSGRPSCVTTYETLAISLESVAVDGKQSALVTEDNQGNPVPGTALVASHLVSAGSGIVGLRLVFGADGGIAADGGPPSSTEWFDAL